MASSTDSQSVDIYLTDASQTQHLPAIIAAAGSKKVNIYFKTASAPGGRPAPGKLASTQTDDALQVEALGDDTAAAAVTKVSFDYMPLEIQISVFKLVFIRNTPQELMLSRCKKSASKGYTTKLIVPLGVSAQLLRVSKVWKQYGEPMILENTVKPATSGTFAHAASHAINFQMPALRMFKYIQIHSWNFNTSGIRRLRPFKRLEFVYIIDHPAYPYLGWRHETSLEPGKAHPILDWKAAMLNSDTMLDARCQTALKISLQGVRYIFQTHYWCTRTFYSGEIVQQKHKLDMEFVLSDQTASGLDVAVESDEVEEDWKVMAVLASSN